MDKHFFTCIYLQGAKKQVKEAPPKKKAPPPPKEVEESSEEESEDEVSCNIVLMICPIVTHQHTVMIKV